MILTRDQIHGYQDKAVDHIIENPRCALFLDMGDLVSTFY